MRFRRQGQGLAEYGLIIALVAIAAILALTLLGNTASQVYSNVVCDIQGAVPSVFPSSPCAHIVVLPPTTNPGGYPAVVKADAPSAYWRLDETGVVNGSVAKDEIPTDGSAGPNGSDPGTYNITSGGGSIVSGISPSALISGNTAAIRGTNVSFASTVDFTNTAHGASMSAATLTALQGVQPRTIEVWFNSIKNNGGYTPHNIFESGTAGAGNAMVISLVTAQDCCLQGTDINYNGYSSQGLAVSFDGVFNRGGSSGYSVVIPKMNLADGHWHYLVVTLSGSSLNIYVDGVQPMGEIAGNGSNGGSYLIQLQPFNLTTAPSTATAPLDWGGNTLGGFPFAGQLDEAAVYDKVLSATQVATHYTAGIGLVIPESNSAYSNATLSGDAQNGCPSDRVAAGTCGPVAYWRLGDNVTQSPVAADAAAGTLNDPGVGNPGNYTGSIGAIYPDINTNPTIPLGAYALDGGSSGNGSAASIKLDSGSSYMAGSNNGTGAGVRVNTLVAMQGDHARAIKLWFQTSSQAYEQALVAETGYFDRTSRYPFNVELLSPGGAGPGGFFAGVGGAPGASQGGIVVATSGGSAFVPASSNLADGHWHYLVVTLGDGNIGNSNLRVYIDDTPTAGYYCCVNNGWAGSPSTYSTIPLPGVPDTILSPDITIGYDIEAASTLGDWFKGNMQDVAIFDYALNTQQISYEWGRAHLPLTAGCRNLSLSNIQGNAYGGTIPGQPMTSGAGPGGVSNGTDAPVSASATQTCDTVGSLGLTGSASVPADPNTVLADSYVAFYYGLEKQVGVNGPGCYQGKESLVANFYGVQIPWNPGVVGGVAQNSNNWVYCYPGDPASPRPNPDATSGAFVGNAPVGVTFYQGLVVMPCTRFSDTNPRFFIQARNTYGETYPGTPASGLPLDAYQSSGAGSLAAVTAARTAYNGTQVASDSRLGLPISGQAVAWGIVNFDTIETGYGNVPGATCLPAPGPFNPRGLDSSGSNDTALGGECVDNSTLSTTRIRAFCAQLSTQNYLSWIQRSGPYVRLLPGTASVGSDQAQPYTANLFDGAGVNQGVVSLSALSISPNGGATGASCTLSGQTCQASAVGTYTVSATNGGTSGTATLSVVNDPYRAAVVADGAAAYWRLGDTGGTTGAAPAVDIIGGNTGNLQGSVAQSPSAGGVVEGVSGALISNGAMTFDGSTGYISVPDAPVFDVGNAAMTLELWMNPTSLNGYHMLMTKGDAGNPSPSQFELRQNNNCIEILANGGGFTRCGLVMGWDYVVATYIPGTGWQLYINGQAAGGVGGTNTPSVSGGVLYIGQRADNCCRFAGTLDEVAWYPSALNATQVHNHFVLTATSIALNPSNATVAINSPQSYTANAFGPGGLDLGAVSLSTLSIDGGGSCNIGAKTCQASVQGTYHVTGTAGSFVASAVVLNTRTSLTYADVVSGSAVAYWRLGDIGGTSAADATGNGHTGTLHNDVVEGTAGAIVGGDSAMTFGGTSNGYISVPDASVFNGSGPMSAEAWVLPNSNAAGCCQMILTKGGWANFEIRLQDSTVYIYAQGGPVAQSRSNVVVAGQWLHIVTTYSAGQWRLYLNGVLVDGPHAGNPPSNTSAEVQIGQRSDGFNFHGVIDEVAWYGMQLSDAEVNTHWLLAAASVTPLAPTGYQTTAMGQSPTAYWRLNDTAGFTAVDAVDGSHNGAAFGGVTLGATGINSDSAMNFDGSTGYVVIGDKSVFDGNGPKTAEVWIKPTNNAAGCCQMVWTKGPWANFEIRLQDSTVYVYAQGGPVAQSANGAVVAGQWMYIVATYDGSAWRLYINGVLAGGPNAGNPPSNTSDPMYLGRRSDGYFYNGEIAQAAWYNSALTAGQILAHFNAR